MQYDRMIDTDVATSALVRLCWRVRCGPPMRAEEEEAGELEGLTSSTKSEASDMAMRQRAPPLPPPTSRPASFATTAGSAREGEGDNSSPPPPQGTGGKKGYIPAERQEEEEEKKAGMVVRRLVEGGADVLYTDPIYRLRPLHWLIRHGRVSSVAACLSTRQHRLDFTTTDDEGWTPLHCVMAPSNTGCDRSRVRVLLSLLMDRYVRLREPLEWGQRTPEGQSFLDMAEECRLLPVVWPLLKQRGLSWELQRASTRDAAADCEGEAVHWSSLV